jgi:DNA polymerase-3 subunit epsilon
MGAHRAMGDVIVNVDVFRRLSHRFKSLSAIFDVLSRPIEMRRMPLGKHKGRPFKELPLDYLRWASHQNYDQDLLYSLRKELSRRKSGSSFNQSSNPFSAL